MTVAVVKYRVFFMLESLLRKSKNLRSSFEEYLRNQDSLQTTPYWVAALVAGVLTVGYAKAFKICSNFSMGLFAKHPYECLIVTPVCFFLAWFIVHRLAPDASGSGIPQVMAVNEMDQDRKSVV